MCDLTNPADADDDDYVGTGDDEYLGIETDPYALDLEMGTDPEQVWAEEEREREVAAMLEKDGRG